MMDNLAPILFFSIMVNLILLRWALREYSNRRNWQKEAVMLEKALRATHTQPGQPTNNASLRLIWLTGAVAVIAAIWFAAVP